MSELQTKIIDLFKSKDETYLTCRDITWELKKNPMHIGKSLKTLTLMGKIKDCYTEYPSDNITYYFLND